MIIGMVRYAVFCSEGEFAKNQKQLKNLYEEPYFTDRFNIFCNITLKSFSEQTDKDFVLCIYQTNTIPKDKRVLFDEIEKKYSFVRCIYIEDAKMPIPEDLIEPRTITFRIDNDDGVPVNFIERLQEIKNNTKESNFVITIPKIRKIMRIGENKYKTNSIYYPLKTHSIGLAYLSDNDKNIMDLGDHTKCYKRYPTKVLDGNGGLQILNGYNVGNSIGKAKSRILDKSSLNILLKKEGYAAVDVSCLPIIKQDINQEKSPVKNTKKWRFCQ